MMTDTTNVSRLSRGKVTREEAEEHSAPPLPAGITEITLYELEELRSRWSLAATDPRRRPHDLQPGETAMFLFQTDSERLPTDDLAALLTLVHMRIFLLTTGVERRAFLRRRVELVSSNNSMELQPEAELGLFPLPGAPAATSSGHTLARSTQDTLQDVFLLSVFQEIFSKTTFQNFFTPPTMLLWRCGGAPASHYSRQYYYEPDLPPSVLRPELQERCLAYGAVLALKTLNSNALIPCYAAFPPVYTPQHLHAMTSQPDKDPEGFTLLMFGASDCPPCRRVLKNAKTLWDALPANTTLYKADWYLAKEARDVVQVDVIPYFVLLKNSEILRQPNPAAHDDPSATAAERWTPVATLQNSDVNNVVCFIHQHTVKLSFDEDF